MICRFKETTSRRFLSAQRSGNTGCTVDGVGGVQCSCTVPNYYCSANADAANTGLAWTRLFFSGSAGTTPKTGNYYVRAVRGGL